MIAMPSVYIPHGGGPCFFMEWDPADFWTSTRIYLEGVLAGLPRRPKAIVLISAHWVEDRHTVGSGASPALIYDYYGFPPHTYQLKYPAPGDPALAARVAGLIADAGLPVASDPDRGFDHGVFVPLKVMVPDADIPVVTLSLRTGYDPAGHLALGKALAPLRDEDVLIVGSGMSFHNMAIMRMPGAEAQQIARSFDDWLRSVVEAEPAERETALARWEQGTNARFAHPAGGEEHLLPLMVAAGAGEDETGRITFTSRDLPLPFSAAQFGGI